MDRRLYFTHKCRTCNYMFVTERDLLLHEASHDRPDFRCSACHEVFDDEAQLSTHAETGCLSSSDDAAGSGRKQHRVCKACGDVFDKVNDLYKHYVDQHLDRDAGTGADVVSSSDASSKCRSSNTPTCAECGATFACWASLKVHVWRTHGVNMAQKLPQFAPVASACAGDESVAAKGRRLAASRGVAADKPFKCSMCNWAFKYDFSLRSHLKVHEEKRRELIRLLQAGKVAPSVVAGAAVAPSSDGLAAANPAPQQLSQPAKKTVIYVQVKRGFPKDVESDEDRPSSSDTADGSVGAKRIRVLTGLRPAVLCNREQHASCQQETTNSYHMSSSESLVSASQNSESIVVPVAECGDSQVGESTSQEDDSSIRNANPANAAVVRSTTPVVSGDDVDDDEEDEPRHFVCKLCNFTCRYDFSYFAHLSQHDKLKELDIADLQAHLVASATGVDDTAADAAENAIGQCGTAFGRPIVISGPDAADPSGDFTIGMLTETGGLTYLQASQVPGIDGVNYILLCTSDNAAERPSADDLIQEVMPGMEYPTGSHGDDPLIVEGSTINIASHPMNIVAEEVEESPCIGLPTYFDAVDGETYYVVSDVVDRGNNQTANSSVGGADQDLLRYTCDVESFCGDNVIAADSVDVTGAGDVGGCAAVEGIGSERGGAGVLGDDDECDSGETVTCYFCNASFTCKSSLQEHMIRLHVD
jgi:DNA-directed RNA polymerase subunit M/transcription elongation factor TFIIS